VQTAHGEEARRKEEQVARFLRLRSTGREWLDALERCVQDLQAGRRIDIDKFDDMVVRLTRDATEAGHALAHAGVWLESDSTDPDGLPLGPDWPERPDLDLTADARSQLLGRLREATREIRAVVLEYSGQQEPHVTSDVLAALDRVKWARAGLNAAILEQIEHLNGLPAGRL
jgi:hypothetical protein